MRLWSLHPSLMDTKGLLALWRESLLAKKVLQNKTKGYRNHPQLVRFKYCADPVNAINYYLSEIHKEAERRNYNFDRSKIDWTFKKQRIKVTDLQVEYELEHLKKKITRTPGHTIMLTKKITHPIFKIIKGDIEFWEIIKDLKA
ncbi:MAG TPA: pyrimidine dimer DNA glycosylase/endonuclease V [Chitinophagaceae bacterium]|nr:pyrimidine dimer DNA glycosylase/endonuclease V [Chitinophagaceae bacterium]